MAGIGWFLLTIIWFWYKRWTTTNSTKNNNIGNIYIVRIVKQVLDYSQYYLDLAVANTKGEAAEWQLEYNLTYYYSLTEVTSVSLHDLADRFSNSEDQFFGR